MNATAFRALLATVFGAIFLAAQPVFAAETVLVQPGSVWQYKNDGTPPGEGWRGLDFNAESWRSGPAQLGYGDGDEATRTEGAEMQPRPITAYFRHRFDILDRGVFDSLLLRLLRDDGAVVYLNGIEVARSNMPEGPITRETLATSTVGGESENLFVPIEIPANALRGGANVLAVEVHQVNMSSSDTSFDLALIGRSGIQPPPRPVVSVAARVRETVEPTPETRVAPAILVFSRTGDLSARLPLYVRYEGTATMGADYQELPTVLTFNAGQAAIEIGVFALQDAVSESTETVVARILEPPSHPESVPYDIAPDRAAAEVFILNAGNPERAIVSVVAEVATTSEPIPNAIIAAGKFVLRRTGPLEQALLVNLRLAGTATAGSDYATIPLTVEISPGEATQSIFVLPNSDDRVEGSETVDVEIAPATREPGYAIDPGASRAVVTILDEDGDDPEDATLEITQPANGQVFLDSGAITIHAVGVDPRGYISRVEFYDGVGLIGVSEITHVIEPEPGTPAQHEFLWQNIPNGEHVLTARAVTTSGDSVRSAPVTITVRDEDPVVPIVSIGFVEFPVMPPIPNADYIPGALEVRRTGSTAEALQVFYRVAEVSVPERPLATADVDYHRLPNFIVIPAGRTSAHIATTAIDDAIPEMREYIPVQLTGVPPNADPIHNANYQIDQEHSNASLYIIDNDGPVSPTVRIARPLNGAVFNLGQWIEIRAEIGNVANFTRLEILADGQVLETFTSHHPGYWHVWHNATLGAHVLSAKLYAGGTVLESERVQILVREQTANSFVHRELPDGYSPGVALTVELRATPPAGSHAYAVEDRPPLGWTVSQISHDGLFDSVSRKVKFGPFTDAESRTLSYVVRPPENGEGIREFEGTSSLNGVAYAIGGDRVIRPGPTTHPADRDNNFSIAIHEATAYAAAWKAGESWPVAPSPIPLSYMTRAGFIWKRGETYQFNPNIATPPFCWVPTGPEPLILYDGTPAQAIRTGPERFSPGVAGTIQLSVRPVGGTYAQAAQERVPAGWAVSSISHDGTFDAASSSIRWGAFYDMEPRTLSYTLTPPANVAVVGRFYGRFSMDGHTMTIEGLEHAASYDERPRLVEPSAESDGTIRLRLDGPTGQVGILQRSSDLVTWDDVSEVFLPDGQAEFVAPRGDLPRGYYRLQIR